MALTELNLPSKAELYQSVRGIGTRELNLHNNRQMAKNMAERIEPADLTNPALDVPADVRTLLLNYREALQILADAFETSTTPTNNLTVRAAFEAVATVI